MRLANARRTKAEDTTDDDVPSTSGRQFTEATTSDSSQSNTLKVELVQILFLLGSYVLYILLCSSLLPQAYYD